MHWLYALALCTGVATADQPAQFLLVRLVLQHVHDRVDAAVGEHGEHGEVVVVAGEVDGRAEVEGEEHELVEGVTEEVADDDDEQRLQQVASGARLLDGRLAADVWPERVHLGAQAHEHPAVAGDEQEDRKQVLQYEQHHPRDLLPRLARVDRHDFAASVDDTGSWHEETQHEYRPGTPGGAS